MKSILAVKVDSFSYRDDGWFVVEAVCDPPYRYTKDRIFIFYNYNLGRIAVHPFEHFDKPTMTLEKGYNINGDEGKPLSGFQDMRARLLDKFNVKLITSSSEL
jgi:hypothetical protein